MGRRIRRPKADTTQYVFKGYFWQITDIHYDLLYSRHGEVVRMCHAGEGNTSAPVPGLFGDVYCDSPWTLAESAVHTMRQNHPKPDFILWTGDNAPHYNFTAAMNNVTIHNITTLLRDTFPETLILPTIGNHDSIPDNDVPVAPSVYYSSLLFNTSWSSMLPNASWETFRSGGFYKVSIGPGLWLIGLNTILWYYKDHEAEGVPDPDEQLAWLEEQLSLARLDKHKIFLSGHVSPGVLKQPWYYPSSSTRLLGLLQAYHDVIPGMFFGHEHRDAYRIVYDDQGEAVIPVFLAPSVTPFTNDMDGWGGNNPAIRLYHYDRATGEVLDIQQYFLNLTEANIQGEARWMLEYQFKDAYELPDLSPLSLHVLAENFKEQDSESFRQYMRYYYVSYNPLPCEGPCKTRQICSITSVDYKRHEDCLQRTSTMLDYEVLEGDMDIPRVDEEEDIPDEPQHPHPEPRRHVPKYMYVVIYCLVVLVIILFLGIALYCCCREPRRVAYFSQPRYVLIT